MTLIARMVHSAVAAIAAAFASTAFPQVFTHYEEPGINAGRSYVSHADYEAIDPFTGNLEMHFVDQVIPGNGGFDLRVQRSYNLLKTSESTSPFGRGWDIHFGRVRSESGASTCSLAPAEDLILELPDGSQQPLYPSFAGGPGGTSPSDRLTTKFWKAQ